MARIFENNCEHIILQRRNKVEGWWCKKRFILPYAVVWFGADRRVICHALHDKISRMTRWNDADYTMKWHRLPHNLRHFAPRNDADCMTTHFSFIHRLHKMLRFIDLHSIHRRLWKEHMEGLSIKKGDWDADVIRLCISFIVNVVCRLVSHDYRPMG